MTCDPIFIVGTIDFSTADPDSVAGLLKQYLRELPGNLLTSELCDKFEEACGNLSIYNLTYSFHSFLLIKKYTWPFYHYTATSLKDGAFEDVKALVQQLPIPNRTLICWVIKHVANVIKNVSQYIRKATFDHTLPIRYCCTLCHCHVNFVFTRKISLKCRYQTWWSYLVQRYIYQHL